MTDQAKPDDNGWTDAFKHSGNPVHHDDPSKTGALAKIGVDFDELNLIKPGAKVVGGAGTYGEVVQEVLEDFVRAGLRLKACPVVDAGTAHMVVRQIYGEGALASIFGQLSELAGESDAKAFHRQLYQIAGRARQKEASR